MTDQIRVAVLFGGASSEHEVSRRSAYAIMSHLDDKYEQIRIGITKNGEWLLYTGDPARIPGGEWESDPANRPCLISPSTAQRGLLLPDTGECLPAVSYTHLTLPTNSRV